MISPLQSDVSLRSLNTFRVEARARHYVRVTSRDQLVELAQLPVWEDEPRLILGGGSNLLLTKDFPGLVLHIALPGLEQTGADDDAVRVRAAAGEPWQRLVDYTLDHGWPGLENLTRIPGTVGAAPIQNIGAYGVELADRFDSLEAFCCDTGEIVVMDSAACQFGYRDSVFRRAPGRYVVLSVTLRLPKTWRPILDYGDVRAVLKSEGVTEPTARDVATAVASIRAAKLPDPAEIGNVGSFFKNPVVPHAVHAELIGRHPLLVSYLQRDGSYKLAAAWLIEQCGWKGRSIGRAAVHERQSLVLVNQGGASGNDVLTLAQAIADSVRSRFGVSLETEALVV